MKIPPRLPLAVRVRYETPVGNNAIDLGFDGRATLYETNESVHDVDAEGSARIFEAVVRLATICMEEVERARRRASSSSN